MTIRAVKVRGEAAEIALAEAQAVLAHVMDDERRGRLADLMAAVRDGAVEGAGLDGRSRWTWTGPPAHRLTLVAAAGTTTVVQACGGTPVACRLVGVGPDGRESWQVPQPTASGDAAPVIGADGNLPTVGALPTSDGTVVLLDPTTSRVVLRPPATARVGRDGALTLAAESDGRCRRTTFVTLDRSSTTSTPGSCASPPPPASAPTSTRPGRTHAWWWPLGDGRPTLEVSAGPPHRGGRGRVVGGDPLQALRVDDEGLTVRDEDVVRRYTWQR